MLDGQLTETEEKKIEAHMATCQECRCVYEAYCALDGELGQLVEAPTQLRENVMSAIHREKTVAFPKKRWMFGSGTAIAAVAAVLVLVVGGYLPSFGIETAETTAVTTTGSADMETAMVRESMASVTGETVMAMPSVASFEEGDFPMVTVDCAASELEELVDCTVLQDENGTYYCWVTGAVLEAICANETYGVALPAGYLDPEQLYRIDCCGH